jgi:cyclophilin family peptidyl-prolyl cis-trans isomerase
MPMLDDQDQRVIPAVLGSLVRVGAADVDKVLVARLTAEDVVVRATAARLLGERKVAGAAAALQAAYREAKRDDTYIARGAMLAALTNLGAAAAGVALKDALQDTDWAVRRRAAELLTSLDPSADVAAIHPAPTGRERAFYDAPSLIAPSYSPQVYIDTAKGTIQIELSVLDAPLTAHNFVALARRGFFKDVVIHRVVPNFVVQDGDPRGDGEGGPGYTIRDEINDLPFLRGTVGMALDWADTGGSQFFITAAPQPHLDGRYTVFGRVVAGMEIVDRIVKGDVIERVRVWDGVELTTAPPASDGTK